ncbi:DoxX family protein [Paenibacillus woosongensis]|uniref:DoxX family membrane protein n=1 Tax=Paenibacillus woosongensis TaxID=307580 RepID=A0A7X2Z1B7_9BACL|nr:DoxX family protein [Paenibacillus woosongensis]MUG45774.1 DoxX family membrane protein [Paenibacillus woosongensis]
MVRKDELGLTLLRLILGITFLIHGLDKFQGGIANTAAFFESLGMPGFAAYVVALVELLGGIAMILGLGTRVVAGLFAIIMAVAILKVKLAIGFLGNGQMAGYELDLILLVVSVYLALKSKSFLALDNILFRTKKD